MTIRLYYNNPADSNMYEYVKDIEYMSRVLYARGYIAETTDIFNAWRAHSTKYFSSWLPLPANERVLFGDLMEYLDVKI